MYMPASHRRILRRTEEAIRVSDPRLASILGIFGRLNRGEEMRAAEQLPDLGRFALRSLPRRLAASRGPRARSLARYVVALFSLLAVIVLMSALIMSGGSAHSARCPRSATVGAPGRGTDVGGCGPGTRHADLVLSRP
jgi:hypothetical protein